MIKINIPDTTEKNQQAFDKFNRECAANYRVEASEDFLSREILAVRQVLHAHGWNTALDNDLRFLVHAIAEQYRAAGLTTYANDQVPVVGAAEKALDGLAEAVVYTLWIYVTTPDSELALVRYESELHGKTYTLFMLDATHQDSRRVLNALVCSGAPTLKDLDLLHRDIANEKAKQSKNSPKPSEITHGKKSEVFRVTGVDPIRYEAVESVSVQEVPFLTRDDHSSAEPESPDPSFATAEEAFAVYAE